MPRILSEMEYTQVGSPSHENDFFFTYSDYHYLSLYNKSRLNTNTCSKPLATKEALSTVIKL